MPVADGRVCAALDAEGKLRRIQFSENGELPAKLGIDGRRRPFVMSA
jgi:hypothetical protein